jgi:AAA domain
MANFISYLKKLGGVASPATSDFRPQTGTVPARVRVPQGSDTTGENGSFRFPASENMVGDQLSERLIRIIRSFAPSQPTQDMSQFAGRLDMLANVVAAIEEHRNHLVLFGGRGTGKTSLALALSSNARRVGYHSSYVSCGRESSIDTLFRSALAELPIRFDQFFDPRASDVDPSLTFDALLPDEPLSLQALVDILGRIRGTRLLVVVDEFDRNENPKLTRDITEIMKVVSDRNIAVQIVIVGVGDVVDSLVGEHASVARVLYAVRLSSMSEDQIRDTISVAANLAGVAISAAAIDAIVHVSHGRPYIARLVGLKTAKMSVLRGSSEATMIDFENGTGELIENLSSAGFGHANGLVSSSPNYMPFFVAMLKCKRDSTDRFTVADVASTLAQHSDSNDKNSAVERALEIVSSPDFGLLNVHPGSPKMYQFIDPRAELCVSVLCWRMQAKRSVPASGGESPRVF